MRWIALLNGIANVLLFIVVGLFTELQIAVETNTK